MKRKLNNLYVCPIYLYVHIKKLHKEFDSMYQASQEGTSGCNPFQNDHYYKLTGGRLSLAGRVS